MKILTGFLFVTVLGLHAYGQKKDYSIYSPDKRLSVVVSVKDKISVSLMYDQKQVMAVDAVQLELDTHEVLGNHANIVSGKITNHDESISAINYKKKTVRDQYQELVLSFRQKFDLVFRAYDDGFAYRFKTSRKDSLIVLREDVAFQFQDDNYAYVPYVNTPRNKDIF